MSGGSAQNIVRASSAASIRGFRFCANFFGTLTNVTSMIFVMTDADHQRSCRTERLGEVLGRVLARLTVQRNSGAADDALRQKGAERPGEERSAGDAGAVGKARVGEGASPTRIRFTNAASNCVPA